MSDLSVKRFSLPKFIRVSYPNGFPFLVFKMEWRYEDICVACLRVLLPGLLRSTCAPILTILVMVQNATVNALVHYCSIVGSYVCNENKKKSEFGGAQFWSTFDDTVLLCMSMKKKKILVDPYQ
jgi:hypothetical protein